MFEPSEGAGGVVTRHGVAPIPGRWGEPNGIPTVLDSNGNTTNPFPVVKQVPTAAPTVTQIYPVYTNPVHPREVGVRLRPRPVLHDGRGRRRRR